jgi:CBS-domain-containing membrane protein
MKAADLMTSFVVTVRPDATIDYAAQLMLQYRISGLPVTDSDGAVLGIVTESDLLSRAETGTEKRLDGSRSSSARVGWRKNTFVRMVAKSARS